MLLFAGRFPGVDEEGSETLLHLHVHAGHQVLGDRHGFVQLQVLKRAVDPSARYLVGFLAVSYTHLYGAISNAGNHLKKPALKTDDAEFFEVIDTHVLSGFSLARECARRMVGRGEGSIVFIGSMSALFGLVDTPAYTASKSALRGLTRELATELSPRGVRVNIIMPGFIESQLMRGAFAREDVYKRQQAGIEKLCGYYNTTPSFKMDISR